MYRIALAAALIAAVPALAQVAPAGYREVPTPAGKSPVKMYAQIDRDECAVGHTPTLAGKIPAQARATAKPCAAEYAAAKPAARAD